MKSPPPQPSPLSTGERGEEEAAPSGVDLRRSGARRELVTKHRYVVDQSKLFKVDEGSRVPPRSVPAGPRPLGCGDALLATATLALCAGGSLRAAALPGSIAAALEVREIGDVPVSAERVRRHLGRREEGESIAVAA